VNFAYEVSLSYSCGSLTCRKILHGADGFNFPRKEIVLQIFIVVKNPSSSAEIRPSNLEFSGNHITIRPSRAT
jgi:hypothetical protein